ncbi:hypothetical protein FBU59_005846 [Linderina macrospora]|uniref:Uncharacterized protein n=1 Tax=Linderina macrospora TaxID=4868 RepID=A0ACC1J1K3_9FUNG|nr:hypothetical protein FBU59_005846 [Linderina macrospora]
MKITTVCTTLVALFAVFSPAAADDICKGHTDKDTVGMPFAHPTICSQFITCGSDKKPYIGNCPAGTYYDLTLKTCTAGAKASCGDRKARRRR